MIKSIKNEICEIKAELYKYKELFYSHFKELFYPNFNGNSYAL